MIFISFPFLLLGNYKLRVRGANRHLPAQPPPPPSLPFCGRIVINRTINNACWKRKGNIKKRNVGRGGVGVAGDVGRGGGVRGRDLV